MTGHMSERPLDSLTYWDSLHGWPHMNFLRAFKPYAICHASMHIANMLTWYKCMNNNTIGHFHQQIDAIWKCGIFEVAAF